MASRPESDIDVVELLLSQHARIEELFREVLAASGEQRRERFEELVRLLAVHETAEEEIVHPLARSRINGGAEVVDARLAEEREAKQLLADLTGAGTEAPDFDERLMLLRDAVLIHAKREERYEFPHLRQHVEHATGQRLADAVRAAEAFAPTRPHPGVESATANLAAGPALAVVDRVRDAVRAAMRRNDGSGSA
jgi:hemerythrin superfamily protein